MSYSIVQYVGDGTTPTWTVPFPYISKTDVQVKVDGVAASFSWPTDSTVTITPTPPNLSVIDIRRITENSISPGTRIVDFSNGANVTEAVLDTSALQMFYMAQENLDNLQEAILLATDGKMDAKTHKIKNVVAGVEADEAVNKGQLDAAALSPVTPAASSISNTPAGNIAATTVQAAINELDSEKADAAATTAALAAKAALAGNNKHTGSNTFQGRLNAASAAGTDTITAGFTPAITALVDNMRVVVRAANANTGPATFNPDGTGATLIEKVVGGIRASLAAGDITGASHDLDMVYNASASRWILLNPKPVVDLLTQYTEWTLASPMVEATAYSVNHGLGGTPKLLQLVLKCLTTELGYAVGDEVQLSGNTNNTNNFGVLSCWASAAQVGATTHASGYIHSITNKTNGSPGAATVGNWALIIRAWK
jgi:hypothetical protein